MPIFVPIFGANMSIIWKLGLLESNLNRVLYKKIAIWFDGKCLWATVEFCENNG